MPILCLRCVRGALCDSTAGLCRRQLALSYQPVGYYRTAPRLLAPASYLSGTRSLWDPVPHRPPPWLRSAALHNCARAGRLGMVNTQVWLRSCDPIARNTSNPWVVRTSYRQAIRKFLPLSKLSDSNTCFCNHCTSLAVHKPCHCDDILCNSESYEGWVRSYGERRDEVWQGSRTRITFDVFVFETICKKTTHHFSIICDIQFSSMSGPSCTLTFHTTTHHNTRTCKVKLKCELSYN